MADCAVFEELISAELDGALTEEEQRALTAHLEECEACRRYRDALRSVSALLAEDVADPPAALAGQIMSSIRAINAPKKKQGRILALRYGSLAVAAALVAVIGIRTLPRMGAKSAAPMMAAAGDTEMYEAPAAPAPSYAVQSAPAESVAFDTAEAAPEAPAPLPEPEEAAENGLMLFSAPAAAADDIEAVMEELAEEEGAAEEESAILRSYRGEGEVFLALYEDGHFELVLDPVCDYTGWGEWSEEDGRLILATDDGAYVYVFTHDGDALVFDEEASSPLFWPEALPGVKILR